VASFFTVLEKSNILLLLSFNCTLKGNGLSLVVAIFPFPLVTAKVYFVPEVPDIPKVNTSCPVTPSG
jgi:hypothetical protein